MRRSLAIARICLRSGPEVACTPIRMKWSGPTLRTRAYTVKFGSFPHVMTTSLCELYLGRLRFPLSYLRLYVRRSALVFSSVVRIRTVLVAAFSS